MGNTECTEKRKKTNARSPQQGDVRNAKDITYVLQKISKYLR